MRIRDLIRPGYYIIIFFVVIMVAPFIFILLQFENSYSFFDTYYINSSILVEIFILLTTISLVRKPRNLIFSAATIFVLIYIVQFMHVYYSGYLMREATLDNIELAPDVINESAYSLGIILIAYIMLTLYMTKSIRQNTHITPKLVAITLLLITIKYATGLYYEANQETEKIGYRVFSPFKEFFLTIHDYLFPEIENSIYTINYDLAANYGFEFLDDKGINRRKEVYSSDFPYKKKNNDSQPNIIILFVESLSARMINAYGKQEIGFTPNLDNFSDISMMVSGYYNHTTPTAPGLLGQLCSIYPPFKHDDLVGNSTPKINNLTCLPEIMSDRLGYKTIYLSHQHNNAQQFDQFISQLGFEKRYLSKQLLKNYLNDTTPELGLSGLSDRQMMLGLVNFLDKESNSLLGSSPFFIGLSTIGTHMGMNIPSRSASFKEIKSNVKKRFLNFDNAFGEFIRYFRSSEYYENTIVIVTADHASFSGIEYRRAAGKDFVPGLFDEIALMIYDPFHHLPKQMGVQATSLDIAPSIYHLIGGDPIIEHNMMGLSIFGDRQNTSGAIALSAYSKFGFLVTDSKGVRRHNKRQRIDDCSNDNLAQCAVDANLFLTVRKLQKDTASLISTKK